MPNDLARYDAMCRAIEEAHSIDEVMLIKDKARAIEAAAKIARNVEAETKSRIIRFRAERRLGELIEPFACKNKDKIKSKGQGILNIAKQLKMSNVTLNLFRRMAEIPKDEFEERIRTKQSSVSVLGYKTISEYSNSSQESLNKGKKETNYSKKLRYIFANASKVTKHNFIRWLVNEGHISHEILDSIYDGTHGEHENSERANA